MSSLDRVGFGGGSHQGSPVTACFPEGASGSPDPTMPIRSESPSRSQGEMPVRIREDAQSSLKASGPGCQNLEWSKRSRQPAPLALSKTAPAAGAHVARRGVSHGAATAARDRAPVQSAGSSAGDDLGDSRCPLGSIPGLSGPHSSNAPVAISHGGACVPTSSRLGRRLADFS